MTTDSPTEAEIARAKRWAEMQVPPVTVERRGHQCWMIRGNELVSIHPYHLSPDAAWSALALALRPIFASVRPVIAEEERGKIVEELRRILRAQHDATVHPHSDDFIQGQKHACIGIDHEIYERWAQK